MYWVKMTTQRTRSIADIVKQAAIDDAEGKKHKGAFDGNRIVNLRGVPQGIVPYTHMGGHITKYFGFLADDKNNLLLFYLNDTPTLASLLKVAEQRRELAMVDGYLHSTDQKMYKLEVKSVIFGGTEGKWILPKIAVQASASLICLESAAAVIRAMA